MRENHSAFHKIWFRPRVLVDVEKVDFSTTMLGTKVDIPFYVTATALGKLGHKEGEVVLTRGAKKHNVVQMIPTLASCSFDEIMDAAEGDQVQWLQLYVNKDREITKKIVQHAEKRGCKGLFITVDAPQLGRREKDMRSKFTDSGSNVQSTGGHETDNSQGAARAISSFIDPALSWKDIPWFLSITKMPIILKGVQRVEDVIRAIEAGVQGVVLSNHGGRQLDFARSGIEVLAEVMPVLRERGWENRIEIFVDGGVRRATDIIKALCLGAKGVGIGRPFLFAMSAYGLPGVDRAMQLLKDEMEMNMRLIGCSSIEQLNPTLVDTRGLSMHTTSVPVDTLVSCAEMMCGAILTCDRDLVFTILWLVLKRRRRRSCRFHEIYEFICDCTYICIVRMYMVFQVVLSDHSFEICSFTWHIFTTDEKCQTARLGSTPLSLSVSPPGFRRQLIRQGLG